MKNLKYIIGFVLVSFFSGHIAPAQSALVFAPELAKEKDVIIVSARKASDYSKIHIKGAVNVDVAKLEAEGGIKGKLKSPAEMAKMLGDKGISRTSKIVVYDNGQNIRAGRLYWILNYLGATDVRMLDGHLKAWKAARKPLTKTGTKLKAVTFTPQVNESLYATKSYVQSKLNSSSAVLVDVQSKEEFDKGHIDGAVIVVHKELLTEDGKLKSKEELGSIFSSAGVTSDKEVILYCASSARAGIAYLALKSILNYPKVRVYEDGYNGWK